MAKDHDSILIYKEEFVFKWKSPVMNEEIPDKWANEKYWRLIYNKQGLWYRILNRAKNRNLFPIGQSKGGMPFIRRENQSLWRCHREQREQKTQVKSTKHSSLMYRQSWNEYQLRLNRCYYGKGCREWLSEISFPKGDN